MASASPMPKATTSDLRDSTISGASWQILSIVGQRCLTLFSTVALARLLLPSAYGLIGMATVFTEALYSLQDLGTASALIQRQEHDDNLASSLFWTNVVLGIIGAAVIFASAPLAAALYHEPAVGRVLAALSVSFLIGNLGVIHRALLARAMRFRRISAVQLSASLASVTVAVIAAACGAGVWSLVAGSTAQSATFAILYWLSSPWRPRWHIALDDLQSVTRHSGNLTASNVLEYVTRNADKALIGRALGTIALGYYSLAYGLMMYPLFNVTMSLGNVLFPAFARLQDSNERLGRAYLRALTVIASVTFPLMLGLIATADLVVSIFFGQRWQPMIPIVVILAPVGMVQSLTYTAGFVYQAKSKTDWMFRWTVLESLVSLAAFVIGVRWGTVGVAAAYAISVAVLLYPGWLIVSRVVDLRIGQLASALWPVLRNAMLMFVSVLVARLAFARTGWTPGSILVATVFSGAAVYTALLVKWRPSLLNGVLCKEDFDRFAWLRRISGLAGH